MRKSIFLLLTILMSSAVFAQNISKEQLIFLTQEWKGERFSDGRPKVSDALLARMKNVSIEEAWGVLRDKGYNNQFEGGWMMLRENQPFAGRALTAMYMPLRPEIQKRMLDKGHGEGRKGPMNSWPIDMLTNGDVYVADGYGKIIDGTLIGDNLGNAIYAKSKNGVVFDASVRDIEGLEEIPGFNAFVRGWDPSFLTQSMLMGLNTPIRIGRATVFPGDVVLAKREGVIFIPAHLAEEVLQEAEFIALQDAFGHQRLKEGKYTAGQIDVKWTDEIKKDFFQWLGSQTLPMPRAELDAFMKKKGF
jgi:4-hydroxy-4-methyl-2-oxoglutarate aldolase